MIVAGIGCRPSATAASIVALVRTAEQHAGCRATLLAAPDFRDGPALDEAAATLGLPLRLIDHATLLSTQPRCRSVSEAARATTGLPAVAEAAALAAAGTASRLRLARIDGAGVTCALAGE